MATEIAETTRTDASPSCPSSADPSDSVAQGENEAPRSPSRNRLTFWIALSVTAAVLLLTMPAEHYPGDAADIRAASFALLKTGDTGIPYACTNLLGEALRNKGQYFFDNETRQKVFSKYGIANTILFIPPLLADRLFSRPSLFGDWTGLTQQLYTRPFLFHLNVYNVFLALVIFAYLFRLAKLYTSRDLVALAFPFSCFFGTFLWNYLRAQTSEIFQVWFTLGFVYHLFAHARLAAHGELVRDARWRHLLASSVYAGLLTLLKTYYALLFPLAFATLVFVGNTAGAGGFRHRIAAHRRHARQFVMSFWLPAFVTVALLLAANAHQFGSPFATGYGQWSADGMTHDRLSLANLPVALHGFFFGVPKNCALHFPVLAVALFGYLGFARRHPYDTGFLVGLFALFVLFISCFSNWSGDICYGPRYLLFVLPVVSLPFVGVLDGLCDQKSRLIRGAAVSCVVLVLAVSAKMQVCVNSLDFFLLDKMSNAFAPLRVPEIAEYFSGHRAWMSDDLIAYKLGRRPFYPIEELRSRLLPNCESAFAEFETGVRRQIQWNYFLSRGRETPPPIRMKFGIRLEPGT